MGSARPGADIIPQLIPHFLMFEERKQKCSQAKNFFDWTNKNVGTIFLLKYLSVSLLYFKHHLECFSWTNVRWAMCTDDQQCLVIPRDRHHLSMTSPASQCHHHMSQSGCFSPNMPDLMTWLTHLDNRLGSRRPSRPGWHFPATRWTSRTSPCDSRH